MSCNLKKQHDLTALKLKKLTFPQSYRISGAFSYKKIKKYIPLGIMNLVLLCFSLLCILPIVAILSISLSDEMTIANYGYSIIPRLISADAYLFIFKNPTDIINSYLVTIFVALTGLFLSLLIMSLIAYPLSRRDFRFRSSITFIIFFTMLFNGGMVPWYIMISNYLRLSNTIWVLVIPYLVNAWNILLLRTFFQTIPFSVIESAKIDGSGEFRTFFLMVLPLSKSALATVGIFVILHYWNDWWLPLLFITDKNLINLQFMLYKIMSNIQALLEQMQNVPGNVNTDSLPNESARMAMCILAAGPMLFIFPFFQKYFVKGLTIGAIKG